MSGADRNGNSRQVARLTIRGQALGESFLAFASRRAERFSLSGWAALRGNELVLVLDGPAALIDMMEVACMLGPIEALVEHVERTDEEPASAGAAGFRVIG